MIVIESPFLLPHEVEQISRLSDMTRWRLERKGKFPKRIRIGGRRVGYNRAAVLNWSEDPEGWVKRNAPAGA